MKEEPEPPSCHSFPAHELEKCTRMDAGDSAEFQPQAEEFRARLRYPGTLTTRTEVPSKLASAVTEWDPNLPSPAAGARRRRYPA
eukprot:3530830-Rhodomonas_salina.2